MEPRRVLVNSRNNADIKSLGMWVSRGRSMATYTLVHFAAYRWIESSNDRIRCVSINVSMKGMPKQIRTTA